jgi:predicted AlkP superfamily phosphohydrolase/phosphomutase
MTAPAWVSFQTGVNPGKHGVFDFFEYDEKGEKNIVNSDSVKSPRIWEILEDYNKSSCIINMPVTYPPPKTKRSIIISSFLTPPGRPYTYPYHIQKELEKIEYKIDVLFEKYGMFIPGEDVAKNRERIYKEALAITEKRVEAVYKLAKLGSWDLFFVLFRMTDVIQHLYWNKKQTHSYYKRLDCYLEEIYSFFKNKYKKSLNFMIISDHGFHKAPKYKFFINYWLKENKYVLDKSKNRAKGIDLVRKTYRLIKKIGIAPDLLKKTRTKLIKKYENKSRLFLDKNQFIWANSYGIYMPKNKLNKKKEIINKLKKLKFNNQAVFQRVYESKKLYSGQNLSNCPQIILLTNPNIIIDPDFFATRIFSGRRTHLLGEHNADRLGIFIGDLINCSKKNHYRRLKIYDISPTVLKILGISIPGNIDGKAVN